MHVIDFQARHSFTLCINKIIVFPSPKSWADVYSVYSYEMVMVSCHTALPCLDSLPVGFLFRILRGFVNASWFLRIEDQVAVPHLRQLVHGSQPLDDHLQDGEVDPEEAAEWRVEVRHDVAQHADGEDGDDAHDKFHAVGVCVEKKDSYEGEEAQCLQERPSEGRSNVRRERNVYSEKNERTFI